MRERDREGVIFKLVNVHTQTRYIKSTRRKSKSFLYAVVVLYDLKCGGGEGKMTSLFILCCHFLFITCSTHAHPSASIR